MTTPVRTAVFPAAGLGTRFLPATKAQPKEMLSLVDKPLIQYVVEEAVSAGIDRIVLVTSRGKSSIEDHFDTTDELERTLEERGKTDLLEQVRAVSSLARVSSVRQARALGLGHAVLQARDETEGAPFAVMLSDDIVDSDEPCIGQMIRIFERRGNPVIALQEVPRSEVHRYGIVAGQPVDDRVFALSDMVEKPPVETAPSRYAIIGRYLLPPEIFEILEETRSDAGGEIQLTSALKALLGRRPVDGYLFEGKRYDAGDKLGYLKATVELAMKREDLGKEFREYLRGLDIPN
ncbi:MAG: UTP--glucose-1-phosphate uridylyltransferase GalU [Acidobacteriota bacterium]